MSKLLEKIFKEKLKDYDAGLSADAWKSFEKRLDTNNGLSATVKYVLWSAGLIAVLAPTLYFLIQSAEDENQLFVENSLNTSIDAAEKTKIEQEKIIVDVTEEFTLGEQNENVQISKSAPHNGESNNLSINTQRLERIEETADRSHFPPLEKDVDKKDYKAPVREKQPINQDEVEGKKEVQMTFIPGVVTDEFICLGETTKVKNTSSSENELVRLDIDGVVLDLQPGKELELNLTSSSQILFLNKKNEVIDTKQIEVLRSDLPVPHVVANVYDEGLPVAEVDLIGTFESAKWYFDNRMIGEGVRQSIHTFYKGNHFAHVKGLDENGCAFNLEIPIHVENDYNLMAPNSLSPEGGDVRRRTFIPFALKQRETPFTMFIIDPRDNDVIYTTRDVNSPWDGVDRRTGKLVSKERPFVWKVQLDEPKEGEKNIYIGNVIHF